VDDLTTLRRRLGGLDPRRASLGDVGAPAFIGKVITAAPAVGKYFLANLIAIAGNEVEGGGASFAETTGQPVPVYLLGPAVPVTGDYLVCKFVDYRWVAERGTAGSGGGGGGVGVIPNCFCTTVPATLTMTSADEMCNYQMFRSCTIQYGPTPACYAALNLPANTFLSVQTFPDPLSNGAIFQYFLTCLYNQFSLTRIYCTSPYGSPYRDGVLYSWVLGGYGNTCSPFRLDSGSAYPGSDATCGVTIDG
jgi:hypothetical protein